MAGIDVLHVPYRNSGEARSGVDRRPGADDDRRGSGDGPQHRGKIRYARWATTGKTRSTVLPQCPDGDRGRHCRYDAPSGSALMAPAGTPRPIIDKINAAVNAAVKRARYRQAMDPAGRGSMSMTPDEFDKFLRGDIVKWAEVVKKFDKPPQ